jgi:ABC-type amino acid transport substrate-binding protein
MLDGWHATRMNARMLSLLPLVLALAPVAQPAQAKPDARAGGVLRVIVATDEAAETFAFAGGDRPGFERELLEAFARLQGLKLEAVRAPSYPDRIPMLLKGEGDVIAAIFDTPERRRQVEFTAEVMPTHNVAVTVAPRPAVDTIELLRTLKVAVVRGASPATDAAEAGIPPRNFVAFDRIDDLLRALQAKEVEAAVLPISEMALASKRVPGLQAGATIGRPGVVAWAVRKDDAALCGALDSYLGNVRRGPTWSRLVVKYFGDQALTVLGRSH